MVVFLEDILYLKAGLLFLGRVPFGSLQLKELLLEQPCLAVETVENSSILLLHFEDLEGIFLPGQF